MYQYIALIFVFLIKITFSTAYGVGVLSQTNITNKTGAIIARDNAFIAGGAAANHERVIRQNNCDNFKRFIRNAPNAVNVNSRANAILALRNAIGNVQLRGIFLNDLEDPFDFLLKRLLRSEIMHQNVPPIPLGVTTNRLNDLLVIVTEAGMALTTGMLVPTPTQGPAAVGRPITWKILTCAHSLPRHRLGDDNPIQMTVIVPSLGMLNLNLASMHVFKQPARNATVDNGAGPLPADTLVFPDVRALPRHDTDGDVAWCELALQDFGHNFLTFTFDIPGVGVAGFPAVAANTLTFQRNIPANPPILYTIRFVNVLADATNLVGAINVAPKNQNYILGFPGFGGGGLTVSQARAPATQLYPVFIDPAGVGNGYTEFSFYHDAPSYWGMSGGPIFHIGPNSVDIFGIVNGAATDFAGALVSRCKGVFIRNF